VVSSAHGNSKSLAFIAACAQMLEIVLPEKADAVIGFRADPELEARIEELARKSTEGELTDDEGLNTRVMCGRTSSSPFSNDKRSRSRTLSHR
jgi:hypothetical protein